MISMFYAQGTTNGNARQGRGGLNTSTAYHRPGGVSLGGMNEYRYTVGLDTRLRMGPFSFDPTVLYQFGNKAIIVRRRCLCSRAARSPGRKYYADINAWLFDVRAGFQLGPLLLEGLGMYTTGNSRSQQHARHDGPVLPAADDGHGLPGRLGYLAHVAGYRLPQRLERGWRPDRIPRREHRLGQVRARAGWRQGHLRHHPGAERHGWCERSLDGREGGSQRHGDCRCRYHAAVHGPRRPRDSEQRYVGTELMALITWRFAPGLTWDNQFGYMFMGPALDGGHRSRPRATATPTTRSCSPLASASRSSSRDRRSFGPGGQPPGPLSFQRFLAATREATYSHAHVEGSRGRWP